MTDGIVPPGYRVYPPKVNMFTEMVGRHAASDRAEAPAMVWDEGTCTFRELAAMTDRVAAGLARLGLEPGDALLLRSPNLPEYAVAALAAWKLGAIAVMSNSLLRPDELAYVLGNCEARIAAAPAALIEPLLTLKDDGRLDHVVVLDDDTAEIPGTIAYADLAEAGATVETADTDAMQPAFLAYSSGTTGNPKGILHAHRWIITMGDVIVLSTDYGPGDVVLSPGEFSFMGTFGHGFAAPLYAGAAIGLYYERPSPQGVLDALASLRVTKLFSVPTFFRRVLKEEGAEEGLDLSTMRFATSAGESLGSTVPEMWKQRFDFPVFEIYGVGEMQVTIANTPFWEVQRGSMGRGLPGICMTVMDDGLEEVAAGEQGRLMIHRSDPGFFLGYHKQRDKWRNAHKGDWYDTGDVVRRDGDGYYHYLGRKDDLFKSRGYFISPQEIENVVIKDHRVREVAVIGVPDEDYGNRICAFVVTGDGVAPSSGLGEEIIALVRQHLAPYKAPKSVEFLDEIPKNPVGKILRRALRPST
jgi:acetyl-CoA synthetase